MLLNADYLNEHCHCSTLDKSKLEHAHFFSQHPHFLSLNDLQQMRAFIGAHERILSAGGLGLPAEKELHRVARRCPARAEDPGLDRRWRG